MIRPDEYVRHDGLALAGLVRRREVSAIELLDAAIARIEAHNPTLNAVVRTRYDAARAEAAQVSTGAPFAGVPFLVKDLLAMIAGEPTGSGNRVLQAIAMPRDSELVRRYRTAGLVIVGRTNTPEFGLTPYTEPAVLGATRNPWSLAHSPGGSSGGSAAAVAARLVPLASGGDGGGSIRIPAAVNGIFGIKPTWGYVSRSGDTSGGTVAHVGPLATSTVDLAHALELMSGPDPNDPQTFAAPRREGGTFVSALGRGVRGLVIGVPESEWEDASEPVQRAGRAALAELEKAGAKLVPLRLELARYVPAMGVVIIACESHTQLREDWRTHADEMGDDLQITFSVLDAFSAIEYLETCRLRTGLRREMARAFGEVDLVAMPSTVSVAAKVSDVDMRTGFLDTKVIDGLCRYAFLGNLTGLPALSAPVGCDAAGLPVGLQLVGDAWDEATVLAASAHLERLGVAVPRRPRITATILP
jgi:aspartyl-tRNA(Asn)/glutamyl-tRNA(Gln) amidotransferase subunit A